jgi:hypothetical protein
MHIFGRFALFWVLEKPKYGKSHANPPLPPQIMSAL